MKAFNIRNKNDAADARAIWLAVQQPGKAVAVKTEMQQAMLALHRAREQLVAWFNHHRLMEPLGYIPPAEAEANYYRQLETAVADPVLT